MMVILKIPIVGLCWIVWHAIKAAPEPTVDESAPGTGGDDDGPHPRPRRPRPPRRGEHGETIPRPPLRVRAIARRPAAVR